MSKNETTVYNSGGPGFLGYLLLIFITLKLTDNIDWSWLLVLSPIWLPFLVMFGLVGLILFAALIVSIFEWLSERRK